MDRNSIPAEIIWGKLQEDRRARLFRYLPLEDHCMDVAVVFRELAALPSFRFGLQLAAGVPLSEEQFDRLAVLALLHDFGKANLGFQDKPFDDKVPRAGHIREIAPLLNEEALSRRLAEALSWETLAGWFERDETWQSYFFAILSHHGRPLSTNDLTTTTILPRLTGGTMTTSAVLSVQSPT